MKRLNINGKDYQYKVFCDVNEWGESVYTEFYDGIEKINKKYRKYLLFGPVIHKTIIKPKFIFELGFDIESPDKTKDEVRKKIEREIELLTRKEEIEQGNII